MITCGCEDEQTDVFGRAEEGGQFTAMLFMLKYFIHLNHILSMYWCNRQYVIKASKNHHGFWENTTITEKLG